MSFKRGDKVKIVENWASLDDFSIPTRYIEAAAADSIWLTIADVVETYTTYAFGVFRLLEDTENFAWPEWLLEQATGEWPMADPAPEEDYYVHTQPGMYKTYQGPRIGEILGRR